MPTYEYACTSCGEHIDVVQSFRDDPLTTCPACGGPLRKVFSSIGVVFKGSGFYKTDSRDKAKSSSTSSEKSSDSTKAADSSKSSDSTKAADSSKSSDSGAKSKDSGSGSGSSSSSPEKKPKDSSKSSPRSGDKAAAS